MGMQDWAEADTAPWTKVNENFDALEGAGLYAHEKQSDSGLTYGFQGGIFKATTKASGTVALTNNATNYIVAGLSGGAVSASTSTTNWNDTAANYARVAIVVTSGGAITTVTDYRFDQYGLFAQLANPGGGAGGGGGGTEQRGLTFTSDTDSTADSDPGAGLFKWNNATQASATQLYFDNQTADGFSVTEFWSDLPATGYVYLQQGDDSARWQLWKWTAVTNAAGYFKLTVTLQGASSTAIADAKTVYCHFDADANTGGGGGSTQGKHSIPVAATAMIPSVTGGCASLAVVASASNQPDITTLDFDPDTEEYAQFSIAMPKKWNEGTITAKIIWSHAAAVTNFGVVWALQAVAVSNDDAIAVAFGTAQTVTDTGGTTNDLYHTAETSAITVGGTPQAEDVVFFRVYRVSADGSDNLAIDARLHGVVVYITTNDDTDA